LKPKTQCKIFGQHLFSEITTNFYMFCPLVKHGGCKQCKEVLDYH